MARKVATTRRALFASPGYLSIAGHPSHPRELSQHQCVLFGPTANDQWRLTNGKQRAAVKPSGSVSADDIVAQKELALQDLGIALLPTFLCREELGAKRLRPVLPDWSSDVVPISVVYAAGKFQHPKIKAFVEEIAPLLTRIYGPSE
jgi:DNA-binding transcriptional LysR family regulator